jgi:hypothetical protein
MVMTSRTFYKYIVSAPIIHFLIGFIDLDCLSANHIMFIFDASKKHLTRILLVKSDETSQLI